MWNGDKRVVEVLASCAGTEVVLFDDGSYGWQNCWCGSSACPVTKWVNAYFAEIRKSNKRDDSVYKRILIYSEELGIYLGSCLGMGFWSKLEPMKQTGAVTFADGDEAQVFIDTWEQTPSDLRFVPVEVKDGLHFFAEMSDCVAAGLPGWEI